jgi:acyl-CoA dehydrogenase
MTESFLSASVRPLLRDLCTPEALRAAERDRWAPDLWKAVADSGLPWVSVPEQPGGSGGTLSDALEVLALAGYYGLPLPVAETMLGSHLLVAAGLALPEGPSSVVPGTAEDELSVKHVAGGLRVEGTVHRVPWASAVRQIVVVAEVDDELAVFSVDAHEVEIAPRSSLAGEPRDTVTIEATVAKGRWARPSDLRPDADFLLRTLMRATMMGGALQRISDMSLQYAGEREQFGRPIRAFQAVQAHLVHLAEEAALVQMAAAAAGLAVADDPLSVAGAAFEVRAAKLIANRGARVASAAAHQVHGAIGCTQEYPLHELSRRLWSWQREAGNDRELTAWLGQRAHAAGADGLYPLVTSGSGV